MPTVLAYWKIRGLAQPIRLLLNYVGEEFEDRMYEVTDGPEYNRDAWFDVKYTLGLDFPNLPYFIDGDIKITQSNAILSHLARKHNLYGSTEADKAVVDMLLSQIMDLRNGFVGLCYNPKFDSLKEKYIEGLNGKIKPFEKFLGDKQFLLGNEVTVPDFHLYEMLDQHLQLVPGLLDTAPKLKAYHKRFEELPAIKKYMSSDKFIKAPLNNKNASFGNK